MDVESMIRGEPLPLVVDLDGTLIKGDLLVDSFFNVMGQAPQTFPQVVKAALADRAALKQFLADRAEIDAAHLPYDPEVLACITAGRAAGRPVYLASASNQRFVAAVVAHLGLFDGWFASDETLNLKGQAKVDRLIERFGSGSFDYIGNDAPDLAVWAHARRAITVRTAPSVLAQLQKQHPDVVSLPTTAARLKDWIKLLRMHQYAKNVLAFVPLLTSHLFNVDSLVASLLGFLAFCLSASSIYIVNDLVDMQADRAHPRKRLRPLASGAISPIAALLVSPLLLVAAIAVASIVSWPFVCVIVAYVVVTTAYSFSLKRKLMIDVVTLAGLYTVRVIGGSIVIGATMSEWLAIFSIFIFTALALVKRYVELAVRIDANLPSPQNRNYRLGELSVVMSMAAASGFNAVTVFALYLSSESVAKMYSRPKVLWLICPLLIYWLGRLLVLADRRMVPDDPVIYAMRDHVSRLTVAAVVVLVLIAI